jgi:hypothetical protein
VSRIRHVAAENKHFARLDLARSYDNAEQGRFADAIGSDQPDYAAGWHFKADGIQRQRTRINLRDAFQARDWPGVVFHCGGNL